MPHDSVDSFDPTQAALIVTYGAALRRRRPLDRDLVLVGQARGCDLPLAAPEIADVHCAIVRTPEGWFVRDCGSRVGTRVNGKPIQHVRLDDGDVLQLGRFAFQAYLPDTAALPAPASNADRNSRQNIRRRLLGLALRLRQRLHQERQARPQRQPGADRAALQADLARQAEQLRDRLRACEQRETKLVEAEQNLANDIAALERETEKSLQRIAAAEQELQHRQAEFEAEMQARRRELDQAAAAVVVPPAEPAPPAAADAAHDEILALRARLDERETELLELRAHLSSGRTESSREIEAYEEELNAFRQELEQTRRQLEEEAEQLQARREEIDEVARAMELEMSRERARLAHERIEINRLREELRMEQERRRGDTVRERLAGLHRLKPA
jgi:pSer/pThr/pTyr-binding forkhead associated (FHA) protein